MSWDPVIWNSHTPADKPAPPEVPVQDACKFTDDLRQDSKTLNQLGRPRESLRIEYAAFVIDQLRDALEWYADELMVYSVTQFREPRSAAHADRGARARKALERVKAYM